MEAANGKEAGGTCTASGHIVANLLSPFIVFAALGSFGALYWLARPLYVRCIELWGFGPNPHLFFDAEYISNQITCWERGVDVYTFNPCDPLGRPHVYSPLWLRLSFINLVPGQIFGLLQDVAFAGALSFLPAIKGRRNQLSLLAALLSPTTMFALERSNIDLSMFVLTIVGLACLERSWRVRVIGYFAFLLATLLKFYPIVLFAKTLSERPRRLAGTAATISAIIVLFLISYHHEIGLALHNVPTPSNFGDGFSSYQLSGGIAFLIQRPRLLFPCWLLVVVLSIGTAIRIARNVAFENALQSISPRAFTCLTAGALLFCGCFLAGPSVGYRGVLLLLVLPGTMEMASSTDDPQFRLSMRLSIAAILLAMWNIALMRRLWPSSILGQALGGAPLIGVWFARELLWWTVFTTLMAVTLRFIFSSQIAGLAKYFLGTRLLTFELELRSYFATLRDSLVMRK